MIHDIPRARALNERAQIMVRPLTMAETSSVDAERRLKVTPRFNALRRGKPQRYALNVMVLSAGRSRTVDTLIVDELDLHREMEGIALDLERLGYGPVAIPAMPRN